MATFVNDTFTDANGTKLLSHTGETGATWVKHSQSSATATINSNAVAADAGSGHLWYASGTPVDANYQLTTRISFSSSPDHVGGAVRINPAANQWYSITYYAPSNRVWVYKNGATSMGFVALGSALSAGDYDIIVDISGSTTTTLVVKFRRVSDGQWLNTGGTFQVAETACLTINDSSSPVTAAGRVGVWLNNGATPVTQITGTDSAPDPTTDIDVNNANLYFSPYNWYSDGSGTLQSSNVKDDATYVLSNNPGAYAKFNFTGTQLKMLVDVSALVSAGVAANQYPYIGYNVDGATTVTKTQLTSASTEVQIATGLADTTHSVEIFFLGVGNSDDRWTTPVQALKIDGFQVDLGDTVTAATVKPNVMIAYGDSNGEGVELNGGSNLVTNQDATRSHLSILASAMDAEVGIVAFSGQGYVTTGSGNVPDFADSWDNYYNGASRLVSGALSPAPDYVVFSHGQNDGTSGLTARVTAMISSLRAAAGAAPIYVLIPPNQDVVAEITAGETNAADASAHLLDTETDWLTGYYRSGTGHMNQLGHALFAAENAFLAQAAGCPECEECPECDCTDPASTHYGTVSGGDDYFNARLHGYDWKNSSTADKTAALIEATELIDQFDYAEQKYAIVALGDDPTEAEIQTANQTQPLEFPRGTVNTVPDDIVEATYLIANALLSGRDPEQELENQTLKTSRFGQLSSARDVAGNTNDHIAHLIPSPRAWNKIRPFLRERNQFTFNRMG